MEKYEKPTLEVIAIDIEQSILSGSDNTHGFDIDHNGNVDDSDR